MKPTIHHSRHSLRYSIFVSSRFHRDGVPCLIFAFLVLSCFLLFSCDSLLQIDSSHAGINNPRVFQNEITATAAVTGIYSEMLNPTGFASGSSTSVTALAGLCADEFIAYTQDQGIIDFEKNAIPTTNPYAETLWNSVYKTIYQANAVIDGLATSPVSPPLKDQLTGEAFFIRAFCHFYLVNLFGDVPIVTTSDYTRNARITRQPTDLVHHQIIDDLQTAQLLLPGTYPDGHRARPNQFVATALLARVYLYLGDWAKAEAAASAVISSSIYRLTDLNDVFLSSSDEAIWQLQPVVPNMTTNEGFYFIITGTPRHLILRHELVDSFTPNDLRRASWINSYSQLSNLYYFPFKYKIAQNSPGQVTEYSMVLRLAEQYLIRSEARAQQNKLPEALDDLDKIRTRAGLSRLSDTDPGMSRDDVLMAIETERRHEFFTEWGHRWLDLKRTNRLLITLSILKENLSEHDQLYPIPEVEFKLNPELGKQNDGY